MTLRHYSRNTCVVSKVSSEVSKGDIYNEVIGVEQNLVQYRCDGIKAPCVELLSNWIVVIGDESVILEGGVADFGHWDEDSKAK